LGGSSYIDNLILRDRATGAGGEGILDERRYYCQNWHHDVVALCDTSGAVIERANYTAYGSPIGTFTAIGNRKGYGGYETDATSTAAYHVRHRTMRHGLGRWNQRDPLHYSGTSTQFAYVYLDSQPLGSTDPTGFDRHVFAFEGLGGVSGISDPFVLIHWKPVITGIPHTHWHYYAQDEVDKAVRDAMEIATTRVVSNDFWPICFAHHTIIVLGYSNGGRAAIQFAEKMHDEEIKVNVGFTADPIPKGLELVPPLIFAPSIFLTKPRCTNRWVNHYQRTDRWLKGHKVKDADVNNKISDLGSDAHVDIPGDSRVTDSLKTEVTNISRWRIDYKCPEPP